MKSSIRIHKPGNQIRRRVSINHSVRIKIKPSHWVKKKEEINLKAHLNIHKAAAIDLQPNCSLLIITNRLKLNENTSVSEVKCCAKDVIIWHIANRKCQARK